MSEAARHASSSGVVTLMVRTEAQRAAFLYSVKTVLYCRSMALRLRWLVVAVCAGSSCLELTLPDEPGPGSIEGTLVYFRPGRASSIPAAGAKVVLKNTSLANTANSDGFFRVQPISRPTGQLLITFDADGDGKTDRQRLIDVAELNAGQGRNVSLGQVTLGLNASISGKVLRGDLGQVRGGHGGTAVLVPEGPYATTCADDGSFLLPDLPEGPVTIAFFREGYELLVQETAVRSGEEVRLQQVTLARAAATTAPSSLSGRVVLGDGTFAAGVVVHLARAGLERSQVTTQADGVFRFEALEAGPYDVAATKEGLLTVTVRNVLLAGGETSVGDLVMAAGPSTPPDFTVLPGLDAGVELDAGRQVDAGAPDAGAFDAGSIDAGPTDAGPIDAGDEPLLAVISPNPIPLALEPALDGGLVDFTIDADLSTGAAPLKYVWESLDVGQGLTYLGVAPSFSSRAVFTLNAGVTPLPDTYTVRLYVEDRFGRQSGYAHAQVRAAFRPVALLTPATVTVSASVRLSCAGSTDRGGLPLSHRFLLSSGNATLQPMGAEVVVTSTGPGTVVVECEAENSFGLVSTRASSTITFTGASDAGLSLGITAPQSVDAGVTVTLTGTVTNPPGAISASWTEVNPAQPFIALTAPTALMTTFVAPEVIGGDQTRRFRLEVRSPPLCTGGPPACQLGVAETTVTLVDRLGPRARLVGSSPLNRYAPVVIEFDEPVINVSNVNVRIMNGTAIANAVVVQDSPTRYQIIPDLALTVGPTWDVRINGTVQDLTRGTQTAGQSLPFTVRPASVTVVNSATLSTAALGPRPGVAVVTPRPGGPLETTAVVAGWRDNQSMLFRPAPPSALGLTEDAMPVATGVLGNTSSRRLFAVGSRVFAVVDTASGPSWANPVDGALFSLDTAAPAPVWSRVAQPGGPTNWPTSVPGPLFTDGTSLFAAAAIPSGLVVARMLNQTQWPDFIANSMAAESVDSTSATPGQTRATGAVFGNTRYLANLTGASLLLRRSTALNSWSTLLPSPVLSYPGVAPKSLRLAVVSGIGAVVAAAPNVAASDVLQLNSHQLSGTWVTQALPAAIVSPTPSFDVANTPSGAHLILTAVTSGKLFVWRRSGLVGAGWELMDGRNGDQSLSDPACSPENPELAITQDGVYVAWAERCAGSWRVALARVE